MDLIARKKFDAIEPSLTGDHTPFMNDTQKSFHATNNPMKNSFVHNSVETIP